MVPKPECRNRFEQEFLVVHPDLSAVMLAFFPSAAVMAAYPTPPRDRQRRLTYACPTGLAASRRGYLLDVEHG